MNEESVVESRARYEYRARLIRVVDGDTLALDVDLGIDTRVKLTVRLHGVNAPEITTNAGLLAKAYVATWLATRTHVDTMLIHTVKDRREKYGRYLVVVLDDQGNTLNHDLVVDGHAEPYTGGAR